MIRGLVLVFSLAGPGARPADRWLGQDKLKHFFTAAFVQSFSYGTLRAAGASHPVALGGATSATVGVSLGKEVWDARGHGTPSVKDVAWDAAGALAASTLLVKVQR
jgi:putative lipoprotein